MRTTSTSRSSETVTRTASSDPKQSRLALRPKPSNRSSPATMLRRLRRPNSASSTTPAPACSTLSSATAMAFDLRPNNIVGANSVRDLDRVDRDLSRPYGRTRLADAPSPPLGPRRQNWGTPARTPPPCRSRCDLAFMSDKAAVLDWRLPPQATQRSGPLPWLPSPPTPVQSSQTWGSYLDQRLKLIGDCAALVRDQAATADAPPAWAEPGSLPNTALLGDIAVWRAATAVNHDDSRPTGRPLLETASAWWQQHLDRAYGSQLSSDAPAPSVAPRPARRDLLPHRGVSRHPAPNR